MNLKTKRILMAIVVLTVATFFQPTRTEAQMTVPVFGCAWTGNYNDICVGGSFGVVRCESALAASSCVRVITWE